MAGVGASVCVLLWKNWRVKQRESRLNRSRTARGQWLFPALVTDIIVPLALLLAFIMKLCEYNVTIGLSFSAAPVMDYANVNTGIAVSDDGDPRMMLLLAAMNQQPQLQLERERKERLLALVTPSTEAVQTRMNAEARMASSVLPLSNALFMTVLPLLLEKSNQSLAFLDRQEAREFLRFLDREYRGSEELGIPTYRDVTKMIPFGDEVTTNQQADELLRNFPAQSGNRVYASLDVRYPTKDSSRLELMAFILKGLIMEGVGTTDQIKLYFSKYVIENKRYLQFPGILLLQAEMNLFLRRRSSSSGTDNDTNEGSLNTTTDSFPSPATVCGAVNKMLKLGQLDWTDFSSTSPLGKGVKDCEAAVRSDRIPERLRWFLKHLTHQLEVKDELSNLRVSTLPKRPQTTVAGQFESNIVFYMAYLFLWPYVRLVRDIVMEKEKQLKEYMLIMGLQPMALLVSWFLLYFFAAIVLGVIAVVMLSGSMFVATQASAWYFFLLLVTFASSILLFGLSITPIFNQAKTAAASASLVYFVLSAGPFIRSLVGEEAMDSSVVLNFVVSRLEKISSPVVFMAALRDIMGLDAITGAIRPIAWSTVSNPCQKMVIQSAGYLLLGWYLENVFPRTYGVQHRWYFVFQPSYWFPRFFVQAPGLSDGENAELLGLEELGQQDFDNSKDDTLREMPLRDYVHQFKPVLFVNSLSKRYPNGKEALKNVSFGVKKGEIFGLLGPNGAGKSTTLSILCGMLSPTSGDAIVGGYASVAKNPEAIRKSLSVCFQQNILFDELSVEEHLYLVCALKNAIGVKTVAQETWEAKLRQFGLLEKRDALSKTLSGGQKRKLSLVLALLDNSRVVLLDEPTAGMDLKARLDTWDALKRAVSHRAVILTTHLMQEAQALCENIGIVADGRLKCCGSSLFLREQFGVGYKLTLVHHEDDSGSDDNDDERRVSTLTLMQAVQAFVPKATVASDNKWETRIQLTDGKESSFVALFEELEAMKARREIKRYAIAATDLEDVFVKVTEGESVYFHAKDDVADVSDAKAAKAESALASYGTRDNTDSAHRPASGFQIMSSQLRALFVKRGKMTIRDKNTILSQYVVPIAIFAILLAVVQHLSMADRSIETLTSLPLSASSSSFYMVASPPELADRVQELLKHTNQDARRFVYREVESEQSMVNAIVSKENATSFFAAAYISHIRLPEATGASATEFPFGGFEYSLFYNKTISRSLPVGLEMLSEMYCRTLKSYAANATTEADFESSCDLVVKTGVLAQHSPSKNATSGEMVDVTSGASVQISISDSSDPTADFVSRIILTYYLLITLSSIVAYYISPIVKEREGGLKRQQYLHLASRATSSLYWISNLLFDFAVYLVAVAAVTLTILVFTTSVPSEMLRVWFIAMVVFGIAMLPFTYLLSLVFSSHSSAQSFMSYASIFQIFAASVVSGMSMVPALCSKVHTISYFLQILPFYTFAMLLTNVATVQFAQGREQCLRFSAQLGGDGGGFGDDDFVNLMTSAAFGSPEKTPSVWDWNVSGSNFAALFVSAVFYSLLLLAFDQKQMYPTLVSHKFSLGWNKVKQALGLASSAASDGVGYDAVPGSASADDIENAKRSLVSVVNVTKVFNPKKAARAPDTNSGGDEAQEDSGPAVLNESGQVVALNDVSFSVEKNDCVALLGVNGSGKSTLFEILTAGTAPTQGRALIANFDVTLQPKESSMQYGYCPQTNIFFSDLNVREHLELFYRLRSRRLSTASEECAVVESLMGRLDLFPVEKTAAAHLSGGNKRRLMLALSLLSDDVSLLLLDEPSAGVDVVARRLMWRVLYEKRESSRHTSCLFTTHSMEEAEAVCANAVVLFKGNLVWCGSIPDLKQHASRGVSISLRLDSAVVLSPDRAAKYVDVVRNHLAQNPESRGLLERGLIRSQDLAAVWNLCRQRYRPTFATAQDNVDTVVAPNHAHRENWLTGVLAKLRTTDNSVAGESAEISSGSDGVIDMDDFVKEWLIQEDFAALEQHLFQQQITRQSGESVKSVDPQSAGSGSNTNAVYETSCTDAFGLAALFGAMEANKTTFAIAQYSISELSLERVFEQFT